MDKRTFLKGVFAASLAGPGVACVPAPTNEKWHGLGSHPPKPPARELKPFAELPPDSGQVKSMIVHNNVLFIATQRQVFYYELGNDSSW